MDVHILVGQPAGHLDPGEVHPGHPEEQDPLVGGEERSRVVALEVRSPFRPAEGAHRPQPTAEPGVQHILVLPPVLRRRPHRFGRIHPHHDLPGLPVVPGRDPVPPPDLPADRPVADLHQPPGVHLLPARRMEPQRPLAHLLPPAVLPALVAAQPQRPLRQRPHPHEPLVGEPVLDGRPGALGAAERHPPVLDPHEEPLRFERGDRLLPGAVAVESPEPLRDGLVQDGVLPHDLDRGQPVPLPDLEVVGVVRRGDLETAGAELGIHALVGDHRDLPAHQREPRGPADEVPVARVLRMDRHRHIPEQGFRAGGGDGEPRPGVAGERVGDAPQVSRLALRGGLHLVVGEGGPVHRAPVDHPLAPVDVPAPVEVGEHRPDGAGEALVHGEPGAPEVAGAAQFLQLVEDHPAVAVAPLPHLLDEGVAAEAPVVHSPGIEVLPDDGLGGDAGVVGAGHPQRVPPGHPPVADQHILDGVVERVAHVEAAGDVRRRDDHREGLLLPVAAGAEAPVGGRLRLEGAGVVPALPGLRFDRLRVEAGGERSGAPGGHPLLRRLGRPLLRAHRFAFTPAARPVVRGRAAPTASRSRRRRSRPSGPSAPRGRSPDPARSARRSRSAGTSAGSGRGPR